MSQSPACKINHNGRKQYESLLHTIEKKRKMFYIVLNTKGFQHASFAYFCNAPTTCSWPEALSELHSCMESISMLKLTGTKEGQDNLHSDTNHYSQARKRTLGADHIYMEDFAQRQAVQTILYVSNWTKISAGPSNCLRDWTADILCLFSPRTWRVGVFFRRMTEMWLEWTMPPMLNT